MPLAKHNFKHVLWLDYETYSEVDLRKVGTHAYAAHPSTEIMLAQYAIDDGETTVIDLTDDDGFSGVMFQLLLTMLKDEDYLVVAHNAPFERAITRHCLNVELRPYRVRCTMVQAYSHALPGALGALGEVLEIPEHLRKLTEGKRLIQKFCKPAPKNRKVSRYTRETDPEDWALFIEYGYFDIEATRACVALMPSINVRGQAQEEWELDQRMNDRGFTVDRELMRAGMVASDREKIRIKEAFVKAVKGKVARPTLRAQALTYLRDQLGVEIADTQKSTFLQYIKLQGDNIDPTVKEIMELMMLANKTSTSKYGKMESMVSADGRFRGGLQFAGASRTRRWAGRGFQVQNLPSRGIPKQAVIEQYIEALKGGYEDLLFDDLMLLASAAIRGMIVPTADKKLAIADLANIEGRLVAWYANEEWKLQAFADQDAGVGPDLYCVTVTEMLGGDPYEVDKTMRNAFGKVPELACGFAGGAGAFQQFANAYGVNFIEYEDILRANIDVRFHDNAADNWDFFGKDMQRPDFREDMSATDWRREWLASETCKLTWRDRHPATVALWSNIKDGCNEAIENPRVTFSMGDRLTARVANWKGNKWLLIQMPSGRYLTYLQPELDSGRITYAGMNPFKHKWGRVDTFPGKFLENIAQSTARDILAGNMLRLDKDGWELLLTVHDEVIGERLDDEHFTQLREAFTETLAFQPPWAKGLPLSAEGAEAYRYGKF